MEDIEKDKEENGKETEDIEKDKEQNKNEKEDEEEDGEWGTILKPELENYVSWASSVNLRKDFAKDGIQVIVKLASIELTPTTPEYDGGSWQVEGQLNEHICASALYYYDSENVTETSLAFRQRVEKQEPGSREYGQVSKINCHNIPCAASSCKPEYVVGKQ